MDCLTCHGGCLLAGRSLLLAEGSNDWRRCFIVRLAILLLGVLRLQPCLCQPGQHRQPILLIFPLTLLTGQMIIYIALVSVLQDDRAFPCRAPLALPLSKPLQQKSQNPNMHGSEASPVYQGPGR